MRHFLAAVALLIGIVNVSNIRVPDNAAYNFDGLLYMGVARVFAGESPGTVHDTVYRAAKDEYPADAFLALTTPAAKFRGQVYRSSAAFAQQIPYYAVKPAYPAGILLLQQAGVGLATAPHLISWAAYAGLVVATFFWLWTFLPWLLAASFAFALFTRPSVFLVAVQSTPDALSALATVTAFWLAASRRWRWALGVGAVAITVRPDNVAWAVLLSGYAALVWDRKFGIASGFSGIALFLALSWWAGMYPWPTFFYHTFIKYMAFQEGFVSPLTLGDYVAFYLDRIPYVLVKSAILPSALLAGGLCIAGRLRYFGRGDTYAALGGIALIQMLIHLAIMPAGYMRHLLPFYVVVIVCVVKTAADALRARTVPL